MKPGHRQLIRSVAACYWIAMAVGSHWPKLGLNVVEVPFGLDKWIHFGAYSGLTVLLSATGWMACRTGGKWRGLCLPASLTALVYSWIDEPTQIFVEGRYLDWGDVVASDLGVLAGTFIWIWIYRRWIAPQSAPAAAL